MLKYKRVDFKVFRWGSAVNNTQMCVVYSALYIYLKLTGSDVRCRRLHDSCNKIFTCSEQFVAECSVTFCCNPPYKEQRLFPKRNSHVTTTWNSSDHSWRPECNRHGELAQMVERPLSMREVPGSIPGFSISFCFFNLTEVIQKKLSSKNFKILQLTALASDTLCTAKLTIAAPSANFPRTTLKENCLLWISFVE